MDTKDIFGIFKGHKKTQDEHAERITSLEERMVDHETKRDEDATSVQILRRKLDLRAHGCHAHGEQCRLRAYYAKHEAL